MLLDLFPALALSLVIMTAGSVLLSRWPSPTPGERLILSWGLGATLLGTLTFLVGLWHFDRWTLTVLDGLLLLAGGPSLVRLARSLAPGLKVFAGEVWATWPRRLLFAALGVFAVLNVIGAATVVLDFDAVRYHLATPHRWLQLGAIRDTPGIVFGSFPMLVQVVYGHALAWRWDATPAILHVTWSLALMAGIYLWARRTWDATVALLAAALFISLTDVSLEVKFPRIDLAVAFYGWATVFCWQRWREEVDPSRRGWLVCAAVLAGGAAASKYTGLFVIGITGLLIMVDWLRRRVGPDKLLTFVLIAGLIAAPWYLKNWIWTGNPVFPYAGMLFRGRLPAELSAAYTAESGGYAPIARTLSNFLLTPLLLTITPDLFASARIGPLWLVFLPLWVWYRPKPAWAKWVLLWLLLFAPLWFWTAAMVRFGFVLFALLAPLLAAILVRCLQQAPWIRWGVAAITTIWLIVAVRSSAIHAVPRIPVAFGLLSPQAVLAAAPAIPDIPRWDYSYNYADLQRAIAVEGPLVVFNTSGLYLDRPLTLAGDLGIDPVAILQARYSDAHCGVVYMLLPDQMFEELDAWVAVRVRPWMDAHHSEVVYRRGLVALYRVDGCSHGPG